MGTLREDLLAVGPQEVRTPNMTVIAHDPVKVNKVLERRSIQQYPTLCSLGGCRTSPKHIEYEMLSSLSSRRDSRSNRAD
jgi:hypothetical protein